MKIITVLILSIVLLCSCDSSKWETIKGSGIDDEPKSIENVIYFENENSGIVGGYILVKDANAGNVDGLAFKPMLFLTNDGGKNWAEVPFRYRLRGSIDKAYLNEDTLICQIDSTILFSSDRGQHFLLVADLIERKKLVSKYFSRNRYDINEHNFFYKAKKYNVKENYQNDYATVIVCYGDETLTNYYFVSFDNRKSWIFLQKTYGDNRARFLLKDKFLFCYQFPFGLQRLKLK